MSPRRSSRASPREGKGKQKATDSPDWHAMHSGSDGSQSGAKSQHGSSTHWTVEDEDALIELALLGKDKMGNGGSFRAAFWSEVANQFPPPTQGKPKTAESCKEKWKRMKSIYDVVDKITNTSGLAYSLERGADIHLESQHVWDGIVKNTKGAARFKNKGWAHYEKMKVLLPSKSKGAHKFTAQDTPILPSSTSHSSVSSPSFATHQTTSWSGEVSGSGGHNAIKTIAPAAISGGNFCATTASHPSAEAGLLRLGPNQPAVSLDKPDHPDLMTGTSYTFPPSPSASQAPSVPPSYVGSTASSVNPSSSISARIERSNKRKADDDDISMASATRGSVVTVATGASTGSRKRRAAAARPSQDVADLYIGVRDDMSALQSTFHANAQLIERVIQSSSSKPSNQSSQLIASLNAAAEKRNTARKIFLERDKDFLTPDEFVIVFDALGKNDDYVDAYLILATSAAGRDTVRHGWLTKRIAEAMQSTDAANK